MGWKKDWAGAKEERKATDQAGLRAGWEREDGSWAGGLLGRERDLLAEASWANEEKKKKRKRLKGV